MAEAQCPGNDRAREATCFGMKKVWSSWCCKRDIPFHDISSFHGRSHPILAVWGKFQLIWPCVSIPLRCCHFPCSPIGISPWTFRLDRLTLGFCIFLVFPVPPGSTLSALSGHLTLAPWLGSRGTCMSASSDPEVVELSLQLPGLQITGRSAPTAASAFIQGLQRGSAQHSAASTAGYQSPRGNGTQGGPIYGPLTGTFSLQSR